MQKPKRILIACPTCALNPNPQEWLMSLLSIINQVRALGFEYACLFPYREQWFVANNFIFDTAFENKFDYILRIDDDIHQVPLNAVQKLVDANKAVIGAAYPNRRFPYMVQAVNRTTPDSLIDICVNNKMVLKPVTQGKDDGEVLKCDLIGFGMTLIRLADFKYISRPFFKFEANVPDDTCFAQLCLDNGIQQYVHIGVQLAHAHVTFANNGFLFNADVLRPKLVEKKENDETATTKC
ncbi:hypothetical protein EKK58_10165 [Candidatus Dependentiae bacterium]|nr:MAG: hypothetical protein EKK58_10165 [Candidatus Dependentiae bacterium]